jgi:hypothetical protein
LGASQGNLRAEKQGKKRKRNSSEKREKASIAYIRGTDAGVSPRRRLRGVRHRRGVVAAAAAKNYDGEDEGEKLELKESQTSEAAQKAVIYDSISIENVNSSSPW